MAEQHTMAGAVAEDAPLLDEHDIEPRTPMKRLGSTRKLAAFNNIRLQLAEQARVLEARAEATSGVAGELQEYCRRRAEVEHEYARALEKLARAGAARHEAQRHKRDQWQLSGALACWQAALESTRALARDHGALAGLYGGALAARHQRAAEDAARLHRKCRDLLHARHEDVAAALAHAHHRAKAHTAAHRAWRLAAAKLRAAIDARADPAKHKKLKALDKELDKRRSRHSAARAAALRARAEYVLSLEGANATLQRYYLDDVGDIMLCMEVGFEAVVGRAARTAAAAEAARGAAAGAAGGALRAAAASLDALADRQQVMAAHAAAFALPRPLAAPPAGEPAAVAALLPAPEPEAEPEAAVRADLAATLAHLDRAARELRAECLENAKTLDAAEDELVKQMEGSDSEWDVSGLFGPEAGAALPLPGPAPEAQEDYYLAKFRAYVACAGRLARVESKAAALRTRLLGGAAPAPAPPPPPGRAARRARGQFAAPLELRLPRVLTECVRVIGTHGLRHQGVFRVSGSQVEMQALRAAFERGEDPLAAADHSDINSVCGLLKLYLRELRPPLLPPQLQDRLLRVAALPDDDAFCSRLRDTLAALPLPAVLVLRYLFAFLAHLAEHAAHNMMDAWNLAVCLGPTLLAAWGDPPHQLAAQNLVNELVKRTILLHDKVFPQDVAPHALYRRPGEAEPEAEEPSVQEEATPEEEACADADEGSLDETDARDQLSLPDEDSDPSEEETSDECEPAEWAHRDTDHYSRSGAEPPPQVSPAPAPAPAPAEPSTSAAPCRRLAESTPDLVLDLPAQPPGSEPLAADTFAHNRDTLKKRAQHKQSRSEGAEGGSPVPARNTARVAAKFAELTLTGGSLKPALAAKPALLRRPTPHPHRPAPRDADPRAPPRCSS